MLTKKELFRNSLSSLNKFELHIKRNSKIYRKPYLALIAGWRLDGSGERRENINVTE